MAWEHAGNGGAADVPMFCKLAPGSRRCEHAITLALPNSGIGGQASALQLFPILGPGNTVWIVTSRYVLDDTLIWTSFDGGQSFGAPSEIPLITTCQPLPPCHLSYSYADLGNIDDVVPSTPARTPYDRQRYLNYLGQPWVYWLESSYNPGLGFNIDATDEVSSGPPGVSEFTFANTGIGGVGGSALGMTSSGDVVEAYWLITSPPALAYYSFQSPSRYAVSPQKGWIGPIRLGAGYLPRMAGGAAGMFMLSADGGSSSSAPSNVDIRSYNAGTHRFGASHRLATGGPSLFEGGGLGENDSTGELAAVWPQFRTSAAMMRLFLSTDGGSKFSPAQYVATIGAGYRDFDNARVAIADNGTGFVTFADDAGLQVADLYPLGATYRTLHSNGKTVKLPVVCPASKGRCKVTVKLSRRGTHRLALGHFRIVGAATHALKLHLGSIAIALLRAHHGRLPVTLTVILRWHGAIAHTTRAHVTIRG